MGLSGAGRFGTPGAALMGWSGWSIGLFGRGGAARGLAGLGGRLKQNDTLVQNNSNELLIFKNLKRLSKLATNVNIDESSKEI